MADERSRRTRPAFDVEKRGVAYFEEHPLYSRFGGRDPAAELAPFVEPMLRRELRRAASLGVRGGIAIEIGAGFGLARRVVTDLGFEYVPCDIATDILARYHDGSSGRSIASTWETMAVRDGACDLLIALDVIEHLPDPRPAIAEAARVLRPGGALLLKTPNPLGAVLPLFDPFADPTHWSVLPSRRWTQALTEAGFAVGSSRVTLTLPLLWRIWQPLAAPLPFPRYGPDIVVLATTAR